MIVPTKRWKRGLALASIVGAVAVSGCSGMSSPGGASASAGQGSKPPAVQDCGVVMIGSPSRYACNGKVYTTFDLAKLRTGDK